MRKNDTHLRMHLCLKTGRGVNWAHGRDTPFVAMSTIDESSLASGVVVEKQSCKWWG